MHPYIRRRMGRTHQLPDPCSRTRLGKTPGYRVPEQLMQTASRRRVHGHEADEWRQAMGQSAAGARRIEARIYRWPSATSPATSPRDLHEDVAFDNKGSTSSTA